MGRSRGCEHFEVSPNPPKDGVWGAVLEEAIGCSSESGIMVLETANQCRKEGAPNRCCHSNKPDRIRILFDDHRLVANAGLLLPATLARHLGLRELRGPSP